ncbi:MAG: outer membrane lipoprotein-sorting protein [Alphaproteobacteria bacterium]|nr:outer membrane lipoprotein-sorting protein [Alphaproteobacteria bacterium]
MNLRVVTLSVLIALSSAGSSLAAPPQFSADSKAKGREITAESIRRDAGFGDTQSRMTMRLMSDSGDANERTLRMNVLEGASDQVGDKSLIFFEMPKDVQGTVLLTHTQILTADDQWIYIPSIARVKRIASSNKSGPFLGSEFAYEDLTAQELGKYDYRWLRDEPCPAPHAALQCFVVERVPHYEASGYKRQIAWIDATEFLFRKIEFYNREDRLLKTLTLANYRKHNERFWRPYELLMINHQSGRSTKLSVTDLKFSTGLTEVDFTEQSMERLR